MPLLQSAATADFAFDFARIPLPNLIVIMIGILIAVAMVLFVLVKYVRKAGFIDMDKNNSVESSAYEMNRAIGEIDEQTRMKVRVITASLKTRLRNIFNEAGMCPVAVIALTNSALGPLYDSVANNHFTTVMLPDNRGEYLNKLLKAIEDEYRSTYNAMFNFECRDKAVIMPRWEKKDENETPKERIQSFLNDWTDSVATETIKSCIKKIDIYKSYESTFKNSKQWSDILGICISKNEKYIFLLDRHGKGWQ
jgi:hypothetical protein